VRATKTVGALIVLAGLLSMGAALGPGEGKRSLGVMPEMVAPGGGPCTTFDLETFLSHVMGYYTREEYGEAY